MHALRYLFTLTWATLWYGTLVILASLLGVGRKPGGFMDTVGRRWARLLLRAADVRVSVEGVEHLAPTGPQIIAANHQSFFDILAILAELPVPVKFVAKKELYRVPVFGGALKGLGHIRIDRQHLREALGAYAIAARELVERRASLLVFVEGTRSRTGMLLPFKKGPFVLAIESRTPIIPAYVAGTFGILPKGSMVVHPSPITIFLGAPVATAGLTPDDRDALVRRVRDAVSALRARSVDAARDHG